MSYFELFDQIWQAINKKKNGNALGDYAYRLSGSVTRREKNSRLESWAGKILCEVATTDNLQRMG